ncbi:hypothetical protein C900_01391 [Fulvivirga imtechensis AK7]|uniref:Bacteroidetes-specific membrane protein n=2 Tax=Fulvivirga TaxID=396811 RepID=L8JXL3_9BACT|nr:hypothetical protein C900_01391 [Fulvivirga imtechensis AK7]
MASFSQSRPLIGQYFQNLPAFAPALTGANDFLDLRLSMRQQWAGFDGGPQTYYLSGYGILKGNTADQYRYRSLRLGAPQSNDIKMQLRHGVGGYILSDQVGPFKQLDVKLNYAVHVPVFHRTFLSFGVSAGLANDKVDISDVSVKNPIDNTYQSYLQDGTSNTYFNLSGGLALNSDRYYISYSLAPLINTFAGGNEGTSIEDESVRHQILLGGRLTISQDVELLPNAFLRIDNTMDPLFDAGLRARYQQKYWVGISYRNSETLIGMLGLVVNDLWKISYSYEYGMGDFNTYNNGTHEIVLGVQLFNYNRYTSMW